MWHLLTLGAMVTCGLLAAWQWGRAESATGSLLNIGYGLQWPLFAVFFGVMWYRMLRLEVRRLAGEQPEEAPPPPMPSQPRASSRSPTRPTPSSPRTTACWRCWPSKIANVRTGPLSDDREAPARLPGR